MAELKTKVSDASVIAYIDQLGERDRDPARALCALMERASGETPKMWGTSMIGFGSYHYKSERSKQEGDWPLTAFAMRKSGISVYIMPGFSAYQELMEKLGKYTTGVSCLYIKKLEDVDLEVLEKLVARSVVEMRERYGVK